MTRLIRILLIGAFLACVTATASKADGILNYDITGPGSSDDFTASFSLPDAPQPSGGGPLLFWFSSLPATVDGVATNLTVYFSVDQVGGASSVDSFYLFGSQLYSWAFSSADPTMNTGTFRLYGLSGGGAGVYTVTVTDRAISATEPASIILVLAGLIGLACFGLLRRRPSVSRHS